MINQAAWVCEDCYKLLGREYECFTDYNYGLVLCVYCGEKIGKHHVINPPDVLLSPADDKIPTQKAD